jgi:AAA family ATP:ADP antiporter
LLSLVRLAKVVENATDYSVQNTARQALFLPTSCEARFKARQRSTRFSGVLEMVLSATVVFVGVRLGVGIWNYAAINILLALIWPAIGDGDYP